MSAIEESGYTSDMATRGNAVSASNDHVAARARALHFASRVPMRCECDDTACQTLILLSLDDFHRVRASGGAVLADGHGPLRRPA
jgi:hypothetical protein